MKPTKVLFLLPYPLDKAPSQRFRIEAFFPLLQVNNISFSTQVFFNSGAWEVLYKNGSIFKKVVAVIKGFAKRTWASLFLVHQYDYIVVHREAAPLGPPVFEWIIAKLWKKKIIFDFDDAIWIPNISEQNRLATLVKCFWKTSKICKWAYKVSAGNDFLAQFARKYNDSVVVIPTCVDTEDRYNKVVEQNTGRPSIGWTGSHSTIKYLDEIAPVLQKLDADFDFDFYVICNKPPLLQLKNLKYIEWNEKTEIEDLGKLNIGVMPLTADQWSEGKCGFKIIQYLALGIPAVASPVGVNSKIIEHSTNGFLCSTNEEWYSNLKQLLRDESHRATMGKEGREKIIKGFSIHANALLFTGLFK